MPVQRWKCPDCGINRAWMHNCDADESVLNACVSFFFHFSEQLFLWYCMNFSGGSFLKSLFVSRITSLEKSLYLFNALVLINLFCFSEWVSFVRWENWHLCRWCRSPAIIYSEIVHILCFGMRWNLICSPRRLGGKNTLIFPWSPCRGPHHCDKRICWCLLFAYTCYEIAVIWPTWIASDRMYPSFSSLGDQRLCWYFHLACMCYEIAFFVLNLVALVRMFPAVFLSSLILLTTTRVFTDICYSAYLRNCY